MTEELPKSVLVITPHPDDAEIGCGGTVAAWVKKGVEAYYVLTTNGDKGSSEPGMTSPRLAEIREREQAEAAEVLGVKEVVYLRHPDGELEDTREFRGELVRAIRRFRPDVVLTTDPFRRTHRDHRMTGQVTIDAVFPYARDPLHFAELTQEGLEPHKVVWIYLWGTDEPTTFVDIKDTLELKVESLLKHASQFTNRQGQRGQFVRDGAKRTGERGNLEFAEGFRVIEFRR